MRKYILIILSLLAMTAAAQVQQRGIVKEYKGKDAKTSLGGVEVAVSRAGKTVTTGDGSFTLTFNTLKPGQRVSVIRIEKAGYEIFNKEALEQWNINPEEPFTIVLCKSEEFRKLRDRYSEVSSASYAKQKAKEEGELALRLKQGEIKQQEYEEAVQQLVADYEAKLSDIEEYADRFARIDLSEVSAIERDIVALVELGDLEGAIKLYEEQDYLKQLEQATVAHDAAARVEAKTAEARDSMMAAVRRQINIYRMAGGGDNYAKIKPLMKGLVDADTTNVTMLLEYADFCEQQKYADEALSMRKKALFVAKTPKDMARAKYVYSDKCSFTRARLEEGVKDAETAHSQDKEDIETLHLVYQFNELLLQCYLNINRTDKCPALYTRMKQCADTLFAHDPGSYIQEYAVATVNYLANVEQSETWKEKVKELTDIMEQHKGKITNCSYLYWLRNTILTDPDNYNIYIKKIHAEADRLLALDEKKNIGEIGWFYFLTSSYTNGDTEADFLKRAERLYEKAFKFDPRRYAERIYSVRRSLVTQHYEHENYREATDMVTKMRPIADYAMSEGVFTPSFGYGLRLWASDIMALDGRTDEAELLREQTFAKLDSINNVKPAEYKHLSYIGDAYHDNANECWGGYFDKAYDYYIRALEKLTPLYEADKQTYLNDYEYLVDKVGWCMYNQDKVDGCKPYYLTAAELMSEMADLDSATYGKELSNIANIACKICVETKDDNPMENLIRYKHRWWNPSMSDHAVQRYIGGEFMTYAENHNYDKEYVDIANKRFMLALNILKPLYDSDEERYRAAYADINDQIAYTYWATQQYVKAIPYYEIAVGLFKELCLKVRDRYDKKYYNPLNCLIDSYINTKDNAKAKRMGLDGIETMMACGNYEIAKWILQNLEYYIPNITKDKTFKKYKAQLGL